MFSIVCQALHYAVFTCVDLYYFLAFTRRRHKGVFKHCRDVYVPKIVFISSDTHIILINIIWVHAHPLFYTTSELFAVISSLSVFTGELRRVDFGLGYGVCVFFLTRVSLSGVPFAGASATDCLEKLVSLLFVMYDIKLCFLTDMTQLYLC